jgi:hypothetical protein
VCSIPTLLPSRESWRTLLAERGETFLGIRGTHDLDEESRFDLTGVGLVEPHWPGSKPSHCAPPAERRGYAVGLHLLPDLRLQELALIVRSAEVRSTRLSELAQALTDEPIHQEQWFPVSLDSDRTYEVSHINSPVLTAYSRIALILSLVPSPEAMSGADVIRMGEKLSAATRGLSAALAQESPSQQATGRIECRSRAGRLPPYRPGPEAVSDPV